MADNGVTRRVAKEDLTVGQKILDFLPANANRNFTAGVIAEEIGFQSNQVSWALSNLLKKYPQLVRVRVGVYRWMPNAPQTQSPQSPPKEKTEQMRRNGLTRDLLAYIRKHPGELIFAEIVAEELHLKSKQVKDGLSRMCRQYPEYMERRGLGVYKWIEKPQNGHKEEVKLEDAVEYTEPEPNKNLVLVKRHGQMLLNIVTEDPKGEKILTQDAETGKLYAVKEMKNFW